MVKFKGQGHKIKKKLFFSISLINDNWFSDDGGRYAYNKQPEICKWNCMKLGEALHPMVSKEITRPVLEEIYDAEYQEHYIQGMRNKVWWDLYLKF